MTLTGCAALPVRSGLYEMDCLYPATVVDVMFIRSAITGGPDPVYGRETKSCWWAQTLGAIIFTLDLPISLVTDTVLFPFDLYQYLRASDEVEQPVEVSQP